MGEVIQFKPKPEPKRTEKVYTFDDLWQSFRNASYEWDEFLGWKLVDPKK